MRFKFFVILVLSINIFSLNFAWAAAQNIDSQIASEERHRKELDKKIKDYRKQIQEMGAKVKSLLGEIDTLQQDEAMAGQELVVLELQNQKIKENINLMSKAMGLEQNKISELEQQIKNRLVDMYKYGVSGEMNLIFASQNISEAVEAVHLLKIINDHDENILSQLKSRYENIELSRHILKEQQELLTRQSKEVEDQRDKYKKTISETNSFIKNIQREKALAEKASREAEEAQRAVGRTITNLMNRKKQKTTTCFSIIM